MKTKFKPDNTARRAARAKRVSEGTWMGRNVTHRRAVNYNKPRMTQ